MKAVSQIIIFIFAIFTSIANAQAQSTSEQLSQMVEQLQKTPTDKALREKIIKLAQTLKPAPAVPEEAQRREGRAKFAFKSAKSNDDYLVAAREYEEAVRVAPWIPGYYSDLCTIYEKAEKYVEAKRNCEFSLIGISDPSQVNEIKQRIAGLEFGIEKANLPQEAAASAQRLEGNWYRIVRLGNNELYRQTFTLTRTANNDLLMTGIMAGENVSPVRLEGGNLRFTEIWYKNYPPFNPRAGDLEAARELLTADGRRFRIGTIEYRGTLSGNGNRLQLTATTVPPSNKGENFWASFWKYSGGPNARFAEEVWVKE